jgi:hypothetical protein
MSVFGLVLVERLFRNVSPDFRWSIKPLCLGLGGTFLFDLYLFSDACCSTGLMRTPSAFAVLRMPWVLPLVALSAIRSHDWKRRLVMSQRAAMQSATLLMVGIYLLFMASRRLLRALFRRRMGAGAADGAALCRPAGSSPR